MMKSRILIFALWNILFIIRAEGQDSSSAGFLSVGLADSSYVVMIDSCCVYHAPLDSLRLTPGSHRIIVEKAREWDPNIIDTTLSIKRFSVTMLAVPLNSSYSILSEPSGASVAIRGETIGNTPLRFTTTQPLTFQVALSLSGYETCFVDPPLMPLTNAQLTPKETSQNVRVLESSHTIPYRKNWIYASIVSSIVCGTTSALARHSVQHFQNEFADTGNLNSHRKANGYTTLATSTLLATEVSFGFLSYLLLGE